MRLFSHIATAPLFAAVVIASGLIVAQADEPPSPGHVAYMLENYDFGRMTTSGVEYPKIDLLIAQPADDVPPECADFVGARQGSLSNGRKLMMVVADVSVDCETTVWMAWGSEPGKPTNIGKPWQKASNGIYKRSGRNMPVGKFLAGTIIDGELILKPTRKTTANFVLQGDQLNVRWGRATAQLALINLSDLRFVMPIAPPWALN